MKKYYFFIIIALICLNSEAQIFKGGVKAGLVATQVNGDQLSGFNKLGLTGGFTLALPLSEKSELSTELIFVQKGSRQNPTENNPSKFLMRLNYIEMPLIYNFKMGKYKIGLEGGLSFGVLLKTEGVEYDLYGKIPTRLEFQKYEFAALAGICYYINDKNKINFRYSQSLLPIRKLPNAPTSFYFFDCGQTNVVAALTYEFEF